MKRLFANNKKVHKIQQKNGTVPLSPDLPTQTPIYYHHVAANPSQHIQPRNDPRDDDISSPYGSPDIPPSPAPYPPSIAPSIRQARDRENQTIRKNTLPTQPIVSNIMRALEPLAAPAAADPAPYSSRSVSEDGFSTVEMPVREHRDQGDRREKKGFWTWERTKDHDKERDRYAREQGRDYPRREGEGAAELTKMIGYLTATASEDWALVLDVCDRVSANESNAKEAVRALRREFKYGEPSGQLSAARLWAIMLRNCSEVFVSQSMNRKFFETLEDLIMNPKTSPVVRERLLDVIAAAAYASGARRDGRSDRDGFRGLWRRVKPMDKPDEGMPFAVDDAMFNPPMNTRNSHYGNPTLNQEPSILPAEVVPASPPPRPPKKKKSPTRNRIIPHDEDIRRLLQECKIGQGNANLLSQALFHAKPESFKKDAVVREFHNKCRSSQELIYAQIPWATAEAEKSRVTANTGGKEEQTKEQQLLNAILEANGELLQALQQYEDMDRVAIERKAELRSMKEIRMDHRERQEVVGDIGPGRNSLQYPMPPVSRSPSPSQRSSSPHHSLEYRRPHLDSAPTSLAPPPSIPHGPRSPGQPAYPRTPSPNIFNSEPQVNGSHHHATPSIIATNFEDANLPVQPSAKALGKQKAVEVDSSDSNSLSARDSAYHDTPRNRRSSHTFDDSDHEDFDDPPWHRPTNYVYDAAAERMAQWMRKENEQQGLLVNGVQ